MKLSKPVAITADSPVDLSPEFAARFTVSIIPMYINLEDKSFKDGVDISPDDIFDAYREKTILPKTSSISIADYHNFFRSFTEKGMAVVHISLSSEISSTYRNALLAAEDLEDVCIVDSRTLSVGMALLAIKASEMRDNGSGAIEIAYELKKMRELTCASFVLDKLEFLRKGGRCSTLAALGANVLSIHPSIEINDGALDISKKYRGKIDVVQLQYVADQLESHDNIDLDRVFICHSGVAPEQIQAAKEIIEKSIPVKEILISRVGCTISTHCGPNCIGFFFMVNAS